MTGITKVRLAVAYGALLVFGSCSQQTYYFLEEVFLKKRTEINAQGVLLSKEILQEDCREDPRPEKNFDGTITRRKQYGVHEVDNMKITPILLFEVDQDGISYSSKISQYLKWDSRKILGFYTFKNGMFEGLLDWGPMLHYDFSTECNYFTIHNSNWTIQEPLWQGYKYLKEQDRGMSFLFGVRHFLNTLWFLEDNKVFVLDLNEMKVYDPDEFIRLKCYDGFIRDIARGGQCIFRSMGASYFGVWVPPKKIG